MIVVITINLFKRAPKGGKKGGSAAAMGKIEKVDLD